MMRDWSATFAKCQSGLNPKPRASSSSGNYEHEKHCCPSVWSSRLGTKHPNVLPTTETRIWQTCLASQTNCNVFNLGSSSLTPRLPPLSLTPLMCNIVAIFATHLFSSRSPSLYIDTMYQWLPWIHCDINVFSVTLTYGFYFRELSWQTQKKQQSLLSEHKLLPQYDEH